MKRTRNIRHDRFRKVRRIALCASVIAVPMLLTACDVKHDEPFSTIGQCQDRYGYTAQHCRQIYNSAIDRAKIEGRQYSSRDECIRDNRDDPRAAQQCQYTQHGSTSHFFYVPRYYSYSPSGYAQPFYRSGTNFRSARGESYQSRFGGRTYTKTTTRGGFGSTPTAHVSRSSASHGG